MADDMHDVIVPNMKFFNFSATAMFFVLLVGGVDVVRGESPAQQTQLKTYPLPLGTKSADLSPDEQFVVTDVYEKNDAAEPGKNPYSDLIQLWNLKQEHHVAKFSTPSPDVRLYTPSSPGGYAASPSLGLRVVRFDPDGGLIAALIGHAIHLLHLPDLTEVRTISLVRPAGVMETHHQNTYVSQFEIRSMEISPTGKMVAVLWVRNSLYGKVQFYDLSGGALTTSWDTPKGWISREGLVWDHTGKLLLLNIPYEPSCQSAKDRPDVFALDSQTGAVMREIKTGLEVGGLAISPDDRVLVAESGCFKLTSHREPQVRVFDLATGKLVRNIPGGATGVRYSVAVSRDGNRCLAFTGNIKTKFDWLDFQAYGARVDETFSIWNLNSYDEILTSQNIPGLEHSTLKLSSRGNFVLSYGRANFVYALP